MPLNSSSLSAKLQLDLETKLGKVIDTFDYAGEPISYDDVVGLGVVTDPNVAILVSKLTAGDPLIVIDEANDESATFNLPLDSAGKVLKGTYKMYYKVEREFTEGGQSISAPSTIVVSGDQEAKLVGFVRVVISGSGSGNDGTYTPVTITENSGDTDIVVSEATLSNEGGGFQAVVTCLYEKTFEYCYDSDDSVLSIELKSNCDAGTLSSTDKTTYQAIETITARTHTLKSPVKSDGTPTVPDIINSTVADNETIQTPQLWTKTWTGLINSSVTRVQADGLEILYVLNGTKEHIVDCDGSEVLTGAYECLKKLKTMYATDCINTGAAKPSTECAVTEATAEMMLYNIKVSTDKATALEHARNVEAIANKYGCDCSTVIASISGEPQLVVGSNIFTGTLGQLMYSNGVGGLTFYGPGTQGQAITFNSSGLPILIGPGTENQIPTWDSNGDLVPADPPGVSWPFDAQYQLALSGAGPGFDPTNLLFIGKNKVLQVGDSGPELARLKTTNALGVGPVSEATGITVAADADHFQEDGDAIVVEGFLSDTNGVSTLGLYYGGTDHSIVNANNKTGWFRIIIEKNGTDLEATTYLFDGTSVTQSTTDTFSPTFTSLISTRVVIPSGVGNLRGVFATKSIDF